MAEYRGLAADRMQELATAGSTGALPFPGVSDGVIYFRTGRVVYAESRRTPGSAPRGRKTGPAAKNLVGILTAVEPTVDAVLESLSSQSAFAAFQPARVPVGSQECSLAVDWLLAEVARRQRLLAQMAAVLTPDTALTRNARMPAPVVGVSAAQWALLIRLRPGSTPRDLAWELGRSVFGSTVEARRLVALGLLSAAGRPGRPLGKPGSAELRGRLTQPLSFIGALPDRNDGAMPDPSEAAPHPGGG